MPHFLSNVLATYLGILLLNLLSGRARDRARLLHPHCYYANARYLYKQLIGGLSEQLKMRITPSSFVFTAPRQLQNGTSVCPHRRPSTPAPSQTHTRRPFYMSPAAREHAARSRRHSSRKDALAHIRPSKLMQRQHDLLLALILRWYDSQRMSKAHRHFQQHLGAPWQV